MILVSIKSKKGVNKNAVANHTEFKDVLLNNKCLRHSVNRIQGKNHRIGTLETRKQILSCLDDKIYILNNGYDPLDLGY